MLDIEVKGNDRKVNSFFQKMLSIAHMSILDKYGKMGVEALAAATPVDTGTTAHSWYYKIEQKNGNSKLIFSNSNVNDGVNIAIILQYGHATRGGTWVEGRDYINPALQPIFDEISKEIDKEVAKI